MRSILTYECGSCFYYVGLNKDKVAFKSTTIWEIVIGECLEHVFLLALIPSTWKVFNIFTISEVVRELQNAFTKDAVENKIKNWLRHCRRYKNNEHGSRNGEDEDLQEDSD